MTSEAQKKLKQLVHSTPKNFNELIALSKSIIACWIEIGYDYPSPYIEEFISIDSQADEIRARSYIEEQNEFFQDFREPCIEELSKLRKLIGR